MTNRTSEESSSVERAGDVENFGGPPLVTVEVPFIRYCVPLLGHMERGFDRAQAEQIIAHQIRARAIEDAFRDVAPVKMRRALEWVDQSEELHAELELLGGRVARALSLTWENQYGKHETIWGPERSMLQTIGSLVDKTVVAFIERRDMIARHK